MWFGIWTAINNFVDLVDFFAPRARKVFLILIILDMLVLCLEACIYNFEDCLETLTGLMFLKYLEIWLTSFYNLVGIGGRIFSILARIGLSIDLLFLLNSGGIFGVNFTKIFCLRVFKFLSAISEFYLD